MPTCRPAAHRRRHSCLLLVLTAQAVAWLAVAQSPLPDGLNPGANLTPFAFAIQADGKIVVGGQFTTLGGQPRTNLARLNADGTLDASFNPVVSGPDVGYMNPWSFYGIGVASIALQPDGRILIGGSFNSVAGQPRTNLARLHPDGSLDGTFALAVTGDWQPCVYSLTTQADGKTLLGGLFTSLGGQPRTNLARLNADGSLDSTFISAPVDGAHTLAVQADGRILVAGGATNLNRLLPDGSLDASFNSWTDGEVGALALQPDGRILVGGNFTTVRGQARARVARLNTDGSVDRGFNPGADHRFTFVTSLVIQADGKILVGGNCDSLSGPTCRYVVRFLPNGSADDTFLPQPVGNWYPWVAALGLQADGKVLLGGWFQSVGGQPRTNLARLNSTDPTTEAFTYAGSTLTWLRGGSGPEVWRTSLEITTNGGAWTKLGDGTRVVGGWQFTGVALSPEATLRARGQVAGGHWNGSSWFIESYYGRPLIVMQPANRTNDAHTTATFSVSAQGYQPLSFQWLKAGVPLANGGNVSGTETAALTLTNVLGADAGIYSVVVSSDSGSVTSQVARLTVNDPLIAGGPAGLNREPGESASFSVTAAGTAPFSYQWLRDGVPLAQATTSSLTLSNLIASDAALYMVVVSNTFGSVTSAPAPLTVNTVTVDTGFDAGSGNNTLYALAFQPDGRILAGGTFYNLGGEYHAHVARLHADGSADSGFNPGCDDMVLSLAVQEDRKLLVGGYFTHLGGSTRNYLGRLNRDGTLDYSFNPNPNGSVSCVAVQPDGKILLGGTFTSVGGQSRTNLARVNPDGSLDAAFNPGVNYVVSSLMVQPDGRIIVGGYFTAVGGQPRTNLARLFPDGSLDPSLTAGATSADAPYSYVSAVALQADGRIIVAGHFVTFGGLTRTNLARLKADGSMDASFQANSSHEEAWVTPSVDSVAVQTDGRILVAGNFTTLGGQPRNYLGRLNGDGSLDLNFNPGVASAIQPLFLKAVAVQPDGDILIGGSFTSVAGIARTNLARLNHTPATESLTRAGSSITWLRGGGGPEVSRTTFDHTSDGITWTNLGAGARIAGGWQLAGVNPPAGGTVRARGFTTTSYQSASGWYVERLLGAPTFVTQPSDRTANAGSTVAFSVAAEGPEPLSYQWLRDDVPLSDGAGISGATWPTLTLSNVLKAAEAGYRVVVSNPNGSVTSTVATLTVIDPVITSWPANRYAEPGQSATFSVTAAGTALSYQWWKEGASLPQATAASLSLTNVQFTDAGGYRVVVNGAFGSLTSSVATLTVNLATLDTGFNPGAVGTVSALALQADGKIVLGGLFTSLAGQTRNRLGRLHANGSLDTGFTPQANATVYSLAVQPDGKILVGGDFTSLAGYSRSYLGRLNTNGALDTTFTASLSGRAQAVLVQPDGKIMVGGRYTTSIPVPPYTRTGGYLSRLGTNGTADASFITTSGVNGPVASLAFQADGKIVAGGLFTTLRGQTRNRIGRLNPDGSLDTGFNPGADGTVLALAVQADGKILVGGGVFTTLAGQPRTNLARLNANGTLDTNFVAATGSSASVYSLALQTDGKLVVGGLFNSVAGQPRANFARLNADGTLDAGANPGPNNYVYGLAIQPDGKIVAVGDFTQIASQSRSRIARLSLPEPATQTLGYNGAALTWQRGGSSPEVGRTTFEFSTNLVTWTLLGAGGRVAGGWELGGPPLLPSGRIRARGYAVGGGFNASSWFVEQTLVVDPNTPPEILTADGGFGFQANEFGFNIAGPIGQVVVVEGSTNLSNWILLLTNTFTDTPFRFSDPGSTNFQWRFYRARLR
jgi:uncharacterized delta-60 repeat protein